MNHFSSSRTNTFCQLDAKSEETFDFFKQETRVLKLKEEKKDLLQEWDFPFSKVDATLIQLSVAGWNGGYIILEKHIYFVDIRRQDIAETVSRSQKVACFLEVSYSN